MFALHRAPKCIKFCRILWLIVTCSLAYALQAWLMGRSASTNLEKAFVMADQGMELHAAWTECSKLEGGATTWANCQRRYRERGDPAAQLCHRRSSHTAAAAAWRGQRSL